MALVRFLQIESVLVPLSNKKKGLVPLQRRRVSQLARPSRRLVLVSGERPNVSQEVVLQFGATSPTEQPHDVSIPVAAEQVPFGPELQVDDARRVEVVRRFAIGSDTDSIGSPGERDMALSDAPARSNSDMQRNNEA